MKNATFGTRDVKKVCENKLRIKFDGKKHFKGWFCHNGFRVARITVPMGRKPIPPNTYKSMATQLKLEVSDFDALLVCTLGLEEYLAKIQKHLKQKKPD